MTMDNNVFRKKIGTTNLGKDYEDIVLADLILKLIKNEDVVDFKVTSNDENFGAFDDIVLEIQYKNRKETYAIQLKHKTNKPLSLEKLRADKGDFSVKKYLESFNEIKTPCKCILFTNTSPNFACDDNGTPINCLDIKILKCDPIELLATSQKSGGYFKFEIDGDTKHKEFFDNFFLYTGQESVECMKKRVLAHFQKSFCCSKNSAEEYLHFINEWSNRDGVKYKLDKSLMQRIIALSVLTPFMTSLNFGEINKKMRILRECIDSFDITVFKTPNYGIIRQLWGDQKCDSNVEEVKRERKKYQLNNLDDAEWGKLLWLMGKCPIIINGNLSTFEAMKLCPSLKYIVIGVESVKDKVHNCSIFESLLDLKSKPNLYEEVTKTFTCSIQGKEEINLMSLIQLNEQICSVLTTSDLVKMLNGCYTIEEQETISSTYIKRHVSVNSIDTKYLENVDKKTIIVLDGVNKYKKIKKKLSNFNHIKISTFLHKKEVEDNENNYEKRHQSDPYHRRLYHTSPILKKFVSGPDLYVTENGCSHADFKQICQRNSDCENYHHFRIENEDSLEWIRSQGDTSDLDRFRKDAIFIEESNLYQSQPETNINLIIGDPGMGKSELLKNIKNNSPPNLWSIFLNSKEVTLLCSRLETSIQNHIDEFFEFILGTKCEDYKQILKYLLVNGQVAYFWDALDEVSTKNLEIVINLIKQLSEKSLFQWVTSRGHLKKQLERNFNVLSRSMSPLNEKEQNRYIHSRLADFCSEENINEVINKIKSTVTLVKHNDILGIPLQIFMLTELFRQDHDKYIKKLQDVFSLTELYHHMIDEKFKVYYEEKANVRSPNHALKQVLDLHKRSMFEHYEKAALKALVTKEVFKRFNINCDDFLKEIQGRDDNIGLITEVTDNFPQFLHNSYAEYFVASYFVEHHKEIPHFEDIIFDKRYANIRFFFDLLTAKDSSAHIAVLYKNFGLLKQCKEELKISQDREGRNPLQLACSWGTQYLTMDVEEDNNIYIIDNTQDDAISGETPEYMEILQYLLENCEFSNSYLPYTEKNNCLMVKLYILLKDSDSLPKLKIDKGAISILYYSAKFGYDKVIDLFEFIPFIKTKKDYSSLLHVAVKYNQKKFLQKLLSLEVYKLNIDDKDQYGRTSLYDACQKGYIEIVQLLIESNANPNVSTIHGCTPLHITCLYSFVKIIQILLKSEANINPTKNYRITPLHVACWNGHHKTVDLLLKSGVDIDAKADDGCTPLYVASRNKHDKVVELLLNHGAKIDQAQNDNVTPLFIACQEGHEENVKLLLKKGADVNIATKTGETPMYVACQNGHEFVVDMLLEHGADLNRAADNGWMPLQIACQQGHFNIVKKLIEAGAEFKNSWTDYCDLLPIANNHGHGNILDFLQQLHEE